MLRKRKRKNSSTLSVELSAEIGFVWLLEWPKPESFQGPAPGPPSGPSGPHLLVRGIWELECPLYFKRSAHVTTFALKKKIHNKVRQIIEKLKKYDLGSRFWSNARQLAKNVFCDWTYCFITTYHIVLCMFLPLALYATIKMIWN